MRERERERERESVGRGTSKGPVQRFVLSRLSGGVVLVSKAFESQVLTLFLFFFFPSLLTDFRKRGKKDGRKSLEVNGTEENPHRTH